MGLDSIDHVVVLMLENRSFDHMLGYLYAAQGNQPSGQDFDGLTGTESNPDGNGNQVPVAQITSQTPNPYWMPLCDPGEGYPNTNQQLFGIDPDAPLPQPLVATNQGFVQNFATALQSPVEPPWPGAAPAGIMQVHTPQTLPVLSGLAQGFAVCDQWFASAPTETMPNRAFALAATSQGHLKDGEDIVYTCPSIYGALTAAGVSWMVYGYTQAPYTQMDFPDTRSAPPANFGRFADFQQQAQEGSLPAFSFLEPEWGNKGNSQHPAYNVAAGEAFILQVYRACRDGQDWDSTLLVITYDEHGGCYDHVAPPQDATPPDANPPTPDFGFDFSRFGVRVPTVLVSPLIAQGTVYRAPGDGPPHDHTSVLATVEKRWGLAPLTQRDAAAPDIGSVLSLDQPRTDEDPLAGVQPPAVTPVTDAAGATIQQDDTPSHIQQVYANLAAQLPIPPAAGAVPADAVNTLTTGTQHSDFIESRLQTWNNIKTSRA